MKSSARLRWAGEGLVFEGSAPGGPLAMFDGGGKRAISPVTGLLLSLAACMAADVVDIAAKMRVPIRDVELDVEADRSDEHPRRLVRAHLSFRIRGGQSDDVTKLERAIALSHEKYCSVMHSLRSDVPVTTALLFEPG